MRWKAQDARSNIDKAEYSVNGGEWLLIHPVTKLSDSPEEDYHLEIDRGSGEQVIAVRVNDEYDNQAVDKVVVKVDRGRHGASFAPAPPVVEIPDWLATPMPTLPSYIAKTTPNPVSNRAPWYANTAPSYAGVFLWIGFYQSYRARNRVARRTAALLGRAGSCRIAELRPLLLRPRDARHADRLSALCCGQLHLRHRRRIPDARPVDGIAANRMVRRQYVSIHYVHPERSQNGCETRHPALLAIVAVLWGFIMGYVGVKGIQYVAKASLYLNLIPFLMILIVFLKTAGGISKYTVPDPHPALAFATLIAIVIGFFATAGAAGTDFGMNSRNASDVKRGGLVGIALPILYAGGLPLLAVMGAKGLDPSLCELGLRLGDRIHRRMARERHVFPVRLASIAPACFCAFIAGNSFSTMIPGVPRMSSTMTGVTVSIILAITGVAANLVPFFQIVGASFGPICGAMAADYLLSGKKWAGPRQGINWAGYSAWALGFLVGIIPFLPVPAAVKEYSQPAVVYSFVVGFLVYALLAKFGAEPETVEVREPNPVGAPLKRARAQASPE